MSPPPVQVRRATAADAVAYGCDLTKGYVDENAAYYSS